MKLKHTVYFMTLVGAMAGLGCWTTQAWVSDYVAGDQERHWLSVALSASLMGAFVGGMTVGFDDFWTSDRVLLRWTAAGIGLGAAAGVLGAAIYVPMETHLIRSGSTHAALVGRALVWWCTGGLIGLVTGLRWAGVNAFRAVHAMLGGLIGGGLGGLVVALAPAHEFAGALAYMLTGSGITVGVTLAPVLFKEGVLVFVSSRDACAQNKYSSPRQEWPLHDGDRLVLGSQPASAAATMYRPEVHVYIPDAMVSPRHAVLVGTKGRFFVQAHSENVAAHGQPARPLLVGSTPVTGSRELRHGDEIVVGQTLLRFSAASQRQAARVACVVLMMLCTGSMARADQPSVEFLRRPQLIECDGWPCFRLEVSGIEGSRIATSLSARELTVTLAGAQLPVVSIDPVRQSDDERGDRVGAPRTTLLLFDSSGSMNQRMPGGQTKFVTAQRQVERLFAELRDGIDEMAIVPFDSQHVSARIQNAVFHRSVADARGALARLQPNRRGNTALFSAVNEAIVVLGARATGRGQVTLIVFTDGINDVGHGSDDPDLLHGPEGLAAVKQRAQQVGVTIYTVGYGAAGVAYDERTMRELAYPPAPAASNFFAATDDARLLAAFDTIAQKSNQALRVLVGPLPQRREQLMGRSLTFQVTSRSGKAESPRWDGTPLGAPGWESELTAHERESLLESPVLDRGWFTGPGLPPPVMRTLVLLTYSVLLAILWFGVPRLLWPERYVARPAVAVAAPREGFGDRAAAATEGTRNRPRPEVTIPPTRRPSAGNAPRRESSPAFANPANSRTAGAVTVLGAPPHHSDSRN